MKPDPPPNRLRFRDLSVKTKLLLLVGAPFLAFTTLLVGLVAAYRLSARADEHAILWAQHAAVIAEVDSLATDYLGLVTNPTITVSAHGDAADIERALARASALSGELAGHFDLEEAEAERELGERLDELVARGREVQASPERAAALRAFFAQSVAPRLHQRVVDEKQGSERAAATARAIRDWANGGVVGISLVVLALSLALLLRAARRFAARIGELEQRAQRVTSGDLAPASWFESSDELGRLARSIDEMVETLRQQRQNQFSFLAAVAHDFRESLGVIQLTTDRLIQVSPDNAEGLKHALAMVQRALARLGRLASDLIDASRIEAGEFRLERELVDVRNIAREIADHYVEASPKHTLRVAVPDAPLMVRADPIRLAQVLQNLIANAIKYSPDGGTIALDVSQRDGKAVLSLTDPGHGIEEASLQMIFEPFRRVSNVPAGVGLGLAITRRLVEAHGGSIDAESVIGHGSTFRVHLPLAPGPEPAPNSDERQQDLRA